MSTETEETTEQDLSNRERTILSLRAAGYETGEDIHEASLLEIGDVAPSLPAAAQIKAEVGGVDDTQESQQRFHEKPLTIPDFYQAAGLGIALAMAFVLFLPVHAEASYTLTILTALSAGFSIGVGLLIAGYWADFPGWTWSDLTTGTVWSSIIVYGFCLMSLMSINLITRGPDAENTPVLPPDSLFGAVLLFLAGIVMFSLGAVHVVTKFDRKLGLKQWRKWGVEPLMSLYNGERGYYTARDRIGSVAADQGRFDEQNEHTLEKVNRCLDDYRRIEKRLEEGGRADEETLKAIEVRRQQLETQRDVLKQIHRNGPATLRERLEQADKEDDANTIMAVVSDCEALLEGLEQTDIELPDVRSEVEEIHDRATSLRSQVMHDVQDRLEGVIQSAESVRDETPPTAPTPSWDTESTQEHTALSSLREWIDGCNRLAREYERVKAEVDSTPDGFDVPDVEQRVSAVREGLESRLEAGTTTIVEQIERVSAMASENPDTAIERYEMLDGLVDELADAMAPIQVSGVVVGGDPISIDELRRRIQLGTELAQIHGVDEFETDPDGAIETLESAVEAVQEPLEDSDDDGDAQSLPEDEVLGQFQTEADEYEPWPGESDLRTAKERAAGLLVEARLEAISQQLDAIDATVESDPETAVERFETVTQRLDALDAGDRERDAEVLRREALHGLVDAQLVRDRRGFDDAVELFEVNSNREARDTFQKVEQSSGETADMAAEHGFEELQARAENLRAASETNADAARRAAYDLDSGIKLTMPDTEQQTDEPEVPPPDQQEQEVTSTPTPRDSVDTSLRDELPDHEVLERIGSGGNADVHLVRLANGTEAALKVPRWHGTLSKSVVEDFRDEAQTWNKLDDHPNVLDIIDWGETPHPWMLLEYADESFAEYIDSETALERSSSIAPVLDALVHAHGRGVVHLDIKPENVLFVDETPTVADWGLSKVLLDHSRSQVGMTPAYAAPEQLSSEFGDIDRRTDVYQTGVLAYEAATGEPPYQATRPIDLRERVLDGTVEPPSEIADVPESFDETVLRAMAVEPADRYETAALFRDALEETLTDLRGLER